MHVTSGCRNKCARERRGLRESERKAAAVRCLCAFCDCMIKFQESKSCGQYCVYSRLASIISGFTSRLVTENVLENRKCFI